ncbi:MAG: hypothetical protein IBJ03_13500 [Gemmatimonadaceae bacterium]|nr:hypothetical protein [Gemmatimonadaceae bacterium]
MLAPAPRVGRSPTTDFTVLLSLVGGLLLWLVLASYSLGRAQRQAGLRLQREVATYLAASVPAAEPVTPALVRLLDSTGLALESPALQRDSTEVIGAPLARIGSASDSRTVIVRRNDTPGFPMAPGMPQTLQLLVSVGLALTCILGAWVLLRLQREHLSTAQRSNFVRVVSHELRTPLAQILMFAETVRLGRTRNEDEHTFAMQAIEQETRRLSRLVENVLRFTRIEHGTDVLQQQVVNVSAIVRETTAHFAPFASSARLSVSVPEMDTYAVGDHDAMRQVVLNLLDNAVKYGPPSQDVRVSVRQSREQVEVLVEDEGPGVPPEDRERMWHAFERGVHERLRGAGTGLGLTIVRTLVDGMGGTIRFEPRDDAATGARFVVQLRTPAGLPTGLAA